MRRDTPNSEAGGINYPDPSTHFRLTIILNSDDPSGALIEHDLCDLLLNFDWTGTLATSIRSGRAGMD